VQALESHPERGDRLLWIQGGSDDYLAELYDHCACLIAASLGEGFGLPLVEAAQHKLPIIARDLPVFREIAGDHAFYFKGDSAEALATRIGEWLALYEAGSHPTSDWVRWLTWRESAEELKRLLDSPADGA
jgi:glycosyltransferase involved in cell wall biosynthesis